MRARRGKRQGAPTGDTRRAQQRRARCQQPRVRSSSVWTAPPSPPRRWPSTWRPAGSSASGRRRTRSARAPGRESDPRQWWDALGEALRQCGDAAREAAAVSVGGQQHGLVTLDAPGEPVRPGAAVERRALGAAGRPLTERAGRREVLGRARRSVPAAAFTVTKWAWLREHEPEAAARDAGRAPPARLPHRAAHRRRARPTAATPPAPAGGRRHGLRRGAAGHVGLDPALLPRGRPARRGRRARCATATTCRSPGAPWSRPAPATTRPPRSASGCAPACRCSASAPPARCTPSPGTGPPTRAAPWRVSPTPAATGCRWPAP